MERDQQLIVHGFLKQAHEDYLILRDQCMTDAQKAAAAALARRKKRKGKGKKGKRKKSGRCVSCLLSLEQCICLVKCVY